MKKDERAPKPPLTSPGVSGEEGSQGPTFEASMKRLGEIVEQLESGELPLDESLRLFEEGVGLSKRAGELLSQAQRKVEALTRAADGTLGTIPFETDQDDRD